MSNSDKYIKAKDLKIGDYFFIAKDGKVFKSSNTIIKIEVVEFSSTKFLIFNGKYIFKYDGSKGLYYYDNNTRDDAFRLLVDDKIPLHIELCSTDKRIATTHSVNFLISKIEGYQSSMKVIADNIMQISKNISSLRFDEFN